MPDEAATPGIRCRCSCRAAGAAPTERRGSTRRAARAGSLGVLAEPGPDGGIACQRRAARQVRSLNDPAPRASPVSALALCSCSLRRLSPLPTLPTAPSMPHAVRVPGHRRHARPRRASAGVGAGRPLAGRRPVRQSRVRSRRRRVDRCARSLLRMSRQDLRADNRNFDEQGAFFDLGRGVGLRFRPAVAIVALRVPAGAAARGERLSRAGTIGGPTPPAVMQSQRLAAGAARRTARPARGHSGLARRRRRESGRAAPTSTSDREVSGSPDAGSAGSSSPGTGSASRSACGRRGRQRQRRALTHWDRARVTCPRSRSRGSADRPRRRRQSGPPSPAERAVGLGGAAYRRVLVTPAFARASPASEAASPQRWYGFGVRGGPGRTWSVGRGVPRRARSVDAARSASVRTQEDVCRNRARASSASGSAGDFDTRRLEVGVTAPQLERAGQPNSYDDRVVALGPAAL